MLYPMKRWTSGPSVSGKVIPGLILLAGAFLTAFAADPPLVGAGQLDPEQSAQAALYLFSPTRCSVASAASGRPDIADISKSTADELRAIRGPLLANAGTHEIPGDLITIPPLVAKIPVVRNVWGVAVQSTPTSQPLGDAP